MKVLLVDTEAGFAILTKCLNIFIDFCAKYGIMEKHMKIQLIAPATILSNLQSQESLPISIKQSMYVLKGVHFKKMAVHLYLQISN